MMDVQHLLLSVMTIFFLTGCEIQEEKLVLDYQLNLLYAKRAELGAKLDGYSSLGVYKHGQCQRIERGVQPAFSCDGTEAQTKVPTILCGIYAARYCLNTLQTSAEDRTGARFCGDIIMTSFQQSERNIVPPEMMEDADVVEALRKCEGVLCQPIDPMIHYQGNILQEKVRSSMSSCMTHMTNACQNRYREWYVRPEKLQSECRPIASHFTAITQEISPLELRLGTIKRSIKYKFLHLIGEI
jgi:hypothetical protein